MNISAAISSAAETLREAGIDEYPREAASLLAFAIRRPAVFLTAHPEYELTDAEAARLDDVVGRRAEREPFQYITGRREFYGLEFEVGPGVLVPRPETEILVEDAIGILSGLENPLFCEIGVGSGCISISILTNNAAAHATAADISPAAIAIAAANAARHRVDFRLRLFESDVYESLAGKFDLIVSNPPYIPDAEIGSLQPEVSKFEPHSALAGGGDGLAIVRRIIAGAPKYLRPAGYLLIEIGFGQAESVKEMFGREIWAEVTFLPDLQGIPRIAKARIK